MSGPVVNIARRIAAVFTRLASTVAAGDGAGAIGFGNATAYGPGTVGGKLRERVQALLSNVVADGTVHGTGTDDLAAWNALLAAPHREVFLPEGKRSLVSARPVNVYGPDVGPGQLLQVLNGNGDTQLLNVETDRHQHVFGVEYLFAAQNALNARSPFTAVFVGDSTTAGDAIVNPAFKIDQLVQQLVADAGYTINVVNNGHSGITTEQWRTAHLADDLAGTPQLMVIRYGINDPGWNKDGSPGTLNAYTAEVATRRDIGDYEVSLRAALTTIRGTFDASQLSVVLMVPNATGDSPNGRDEKWYEQVRRVVARAARDFQCGFVDTYAKFPGCRGASGKWMDDAFGDGRAIHPLDIMNVWIASAIRDLLIPSGLQVRHVLSSTHQPLVTDLPKFFPVGHSTWRVTWNVEGVVVDGALENIRTADGVSIQRVWDFTTPGRVSERLSANPTAWQPWLSTPSQAIAATGGWNAAAGNRGITFEKVNGRVYLRGRLTGGATAGHTLLVTLPADCAPINDEFRAALCGGSLNQQAILAISSSVPGAVYLESCPSNTLLDVACEWSTQ